jgi:integrase
VRRTAGICASAAQREPCQNQEGPRGTGQGRGEKGRAAAERTTARVVCRRATDTEPRYCRLPANAAADWRKPGEVLALRWEDVNTKWKGLTIRDKVEGEREIPLTPYVLHLLAALPRRNEWVFSSTARGQDTEGQP